MFQPKFKGDRDHVIGMAARKIAEACNIPRRILDQIKADGLDIIDKIQSSHTSYNIAQWVLMSCLVDYKFCEHAAWQGIPSEWWDIPLPAEPGRAGADDCQ